MRLNKNIIDFFDVSIIIPFCSNDEDFETTNCFNYSIFQGNGIEVLLVLSSQLDFHAAEILIDEYPFVNWKVVMAGAENDINGLLSFTLNRFVLLLDGYNGFSIESVYDLVNAILLNKSVAAYLQITDCDKVDGNTFLLFDKIHAYRIAFPAGAALLHQVVLTAFRSSTSEETFIDDEGIKIKYLVLKGPNPQTKLLGDCDFKNRKGHFLHHYLYNKSKQLKQVVLQRFLEYQEVAKDCFERRCKVICLIQTRNECNAINETLSHFDQYFDGIVLLDDGSTDGTYETALASKLLLKARKKFTPGFYDLENRNLLLQLGNLLKTEWFVFMDADERLDSRFSDFSLITKNKSINTVIFRLVHLWNSSSFYRKDLPEGKEGIFLRYRMFRNRGFTQIHANRELHFPQVPFKSNRIISNILILHHGLREKNVRYAKYKRYMLQDSDNKKQKFSYDYLLDENVINGQVDEIVF